MDSLSGPFPSSLTFSYSAPPTHTHTHHPYHPAIPQPVGTQTDCKVSLAGSQEPELDAGATANLAQALQSLLCSLRACFFTCQMWAKKPHPICSLGLRAMR